MLAKFARLTASGDLWLLQVPGAGRADTVTLCSLVFLLQLNLCLYQTNFSALPVSAGSACLLLQSKAGSGVERHLLGATAAPATLIVHSTKHFSQASTVSLCLSSRLWNQWGSWPWFSSLPLLLCISAHVSHSQCSSHAQPISVNKHLC